MGGFALYIRMISFGRPIAKQIFNMFHTPYGVEYSIDVMGHTKRNWSTLKEAVLSAIKRYLNGNNWTQNGISMHSGPPHS